MKKNPKSKRREAEVAAVHYCHEVLDCVKTVKAVKTQWQRQDMFACDVLGKRADGSLCAIQVTAGQDQAVTARKRKIEKIPWHKNDTVELLQLRYEMKGRTKAWYFKVWSYDGILDLWCLYDNVEIWKEWFKVRKEDFE